jgi:hypothetical protein
VETPTKLRNLCRVRGTGVDQTVLSAVMNRAPHT